MEPKVMSWLFGRSIWNIGQSFGDTAHLLANPSIISANNLINPLCYLFYSIIQAYSMSLTLAHTHTHTLQRRTYTLHTSCKTIFFPTSTLSWLSSESHYQLTVQHIISYLFYSLYVLLSNVFIHFPSFL